MVEPEGLHQDDLNYLPYNGLKTPIIIVCKAFSNCKRQKYEIFNKKMISFFYLVQLFHQHRAFRRPDIDVMFHINDLKSVHLVLHKMDTTWNTIYQGEIGLFAMIITTTSMCAVA